MTCNQCKFWISDGTKVLRKTPKGYGWLVGPIPGVTTGFCAISAPQPGKDRDDMWPVTRSTDWCGKWEDKA